MVAVASEVGLDLSSSGINGAHKEPTYQWTYSQAVFFTFTTLAMIGGFGVRTKGGLRGGWPKGGNSTDTSVTVTRGRGDVKSPKKNCGRQM